MSMSVRLDRQTEAILEKTARILGTTRSDVIKKSIRDFCARTLADPRRRPYELLRDLVGSERSGRGDLSVRGEEILRKRFGGRG